MTKTIFVEIEGVLGDHSHRSEFKRDYENYATLAEDDQPNTDIIEILNVLSDSYNIVLFSMRNERNRLSAEDWLLENDVSYDELLLRDDNDYTSENSLRFDMVMDYFGDERKVVEKTAFVATNSETAAEKFREIGIRVISVDWG